jgi:hypothetical protein
LILKILLVRSSEHLTHFEAVRLGKLTSGLPRNFCIEDLLHCIGNVATILCCDHICLSSIAVDRLDDLWDFGHNRLFRILDLFDLFVALVGHIG